MQIGRIAREGADGPEPRVVVVDPAAGTVTDVRGVERRRHEAAGATGTAARRLAAALVPGSLAAALEAGPAFAEALDRAATDASGACTSALADERLLTPVDAPGYRDFMAFEEHVINAAARAGGTVGDDYYALPMHYRGSHTALIAHEAEVPWPLYGASMDYELELGVVIGRAGVDLRPEDALGHVLGLTVLDDFSLRDIQAREMRGMLGPAKAKHFATAIGPWITTLDGLELDGLGMVARVNGEPWSRGNTATLTWSIAELVAWASAGESLVPGELLGSGTVGLGCGMELGRELAEGDVVELEIEELGVLRNRIGPRATNGWHPEPHPRRAA